MARPALPTGIVPESIRSVMQWLHGQWGATADRIAVTDGSGDVVLQDAADVRDTIDVYAKADVNTKAEADAAFVPATIVKVTEDDATNVTTQIQAYIDAADPGDTVFLPYGGSKYLVDTLVIDKALTLETKGGRLRLATAGTPLIEVTASDVKLGKSLRLEGSGYGDIDTDEQLIYAHGADADNYISGLEVECVAHDTVGIGLHMQFVENFDISRFTSKRCTYAGVHGLSCQDGVVDRPYVQDVGDPTTGSGHASGLAYGVMFSRASHDSLVTHPRSARVDVIGGIVRNVPTWEAYDTHGGEEIRFIDCKAYSARVAVAIVNSAGTAGAGDEKYSPHACVVSGFYGESGVSDGSAGYGIVVEGMPDDFNRDTHVLDVELHGYGDESDSEAAAIHMRRTARAVVKRATLVEPSPIGVAWISDNYDYVCEDITVVDHWTETSALTAAVSPARQANNTGRIAGITSVDAGNKAAATLDNQRGLYYAVTTGVDVVDQGGHSLDVTTPQSGGTAVSKSRHRVPVEIDQGITVGTAGSKLATYLTGTESLVWSEIAAGATAEQTISVPGATTADAAEVAVLGNPGAGFMWCCYPFPSDEVTVRMHNTTGSAATPTTRTWRAVVKKH